MSGLIVTNPPRAQAEDVEALGGYGVATVHEGMGRTGSLGPGFRPVQQDVRIAGTAVTALCRPGDNLMIHAAVEQCRDGDILVVTTTSPSTDGMFGDLFGGTSKGAYFLAEDLPADAGARDDLLQRVMGSPDPRQIDGLGGAHPLTSKVAVVSRSQSPDAQVDYLFLQVGVDRAEVSDRQNCGNLLAGVGPFAVERGLVAARDGHTSVRIRMVNSGDHATATFPTPDRRVSYAGPAEISGVPGTAAPVVIEFERGSNPLLPTGHARDIVADTAVTCVDNGMPTVLIAASSLHVTGYERPRDLEEDLTLHDRLQRIRLEASLLMGLGDVSETTVPKLSLLAPPTNGGAVMTRTFIPVRCHTACPGSRQCRRRAARPRRRRPARRPSARQRRTVAHRASHRIPRHRERDRRRHPGGRPRGPPYRRRPHRTQDLRRYGLPPAGRSRTPPLRRPAWPRPSATSPTSGTSNCSPRTWTEVCGSSPTASV
ncbi:PrpF domain-containing protein [Streptomyces mirabilis]